LATATSLISSLPKDTLLNPTSSYTLLLASLAQSKTDAEFAKEMVPAVLAIVMTATDAPLILAILSLALVTSQTRTARITLFAQLTPATLILETVSTPICAMIPMLVPPTVAIPLQVAAMLQLFAMIMMLAPPTLVTTP